MSGTLEIDDRRIYSEFAVRQALGLSPRVLAAARKRGELRGRMVEKGRYLYSGADLRAWIDRTEQPATTTQGVAEC